MDEFWVPAQVAKTEVQANAYQIFLPVIYITEQNRNVERTDLKENPTDLNEKIQNLKKMCG